MKQTIHAKSYLYFTIIYFLICNTLTAQERYDVFTTTHLYESPNSGSKKLGVFARGGYIIKLDNIDGNWWKVEADNKMTGYVQSQYIKKYLNAGDNYKPDPDVFVGKEGVLGCPHLFVQVASLKGRKGPSTNDKIEQILLINSAYCVSFLPTDKEKWVNIGNSDAGNAIYVQRKFLGKQLNIQDVIDYYSNIDKTDTANRKLYIERIAEMSVHESAENRIKALELYLKYAKEVNDENIVKNIDFDLLVARSTQNPYSYEEKSKILSSEKTYIEIDGVRLGWSFYLEKINKIKRPFNKVKDPEGYECGAVVDLQYLYKDLTINLNTVDKDAYIEKIDLSADGNAFIINGYRINKDTDEADFLKQQGRLFDANFRIPHFYRLYLEDYAVIDITFENGKPKSFWQFILC